MERLSSYSFQAEATQSQTCRVLPCVYVSSLKALTPAQLTLAQTHFPMMLPVCYSLKSIGLDTDTNTFSNVATSLLTSIFEKQFSF